MSASTLQIRTRAEMLRPVYKRELYLPTQRHLRRSVCKGGGNSYFGATGAPALGHPAGTDKVQTRHTRGHEAVVSNDSFGVLVR